MIWTIISYICTFLFGGIAGMVIMGLCAAAHENEKYEDEDGNLK